MNSNFLIGIEYNPFNGDYMACFADGQTITLSANNYEDAVLEADQLEMGNYELGYN